MATNNKFIHFKTRAGFDAELERKGISDPSAAEGNDFYYYTVFIKDTKEIYTHGQFYNASTDIGVEDDDGTLGDVPTNTYVQYVQQHLTEDEQTVARNNIGACARRPIVTSLPSTGGCLPNVYYKINVSDTCEIELATSNSGYLDEYFIQLTTGSDECEITWSDSLHWADGSQLTTLDPDSTYQISIIDNLATYLKFY